MDRSHQVSGSIRGCKVTLNVGVEDLHSRLDKAAAGEVLILLYQREPRLQQLVICFHINHIILIQLKETENIAGTNRDYS